MKPFRNKLFVFLFITWLGACLSSYASFVSIDNYFHNFYYLGLALSLKTLAASLFSYKSDALIRKIDIRRSFILSQLLGFLAVSILFLGFYFKCFSIVIIGIMLSAIPTVMVAILLTITLKISANTDLEYRKNSGLREFVTGIAMLAAAVLTPILLIEFGLNVIFFVNIITYFVSFILLKNLSYPSLVNSDAQIKIPANIFRSSNTWIFIIQTFAALILVALVPIFASSNTISLTKNLPEILRQWIWGVDACMWIFASSIYLLSKHFKNVRIFDFMLVCNGIFLSLFFISNGTIMMFLVLIGVSLCCSVSFFRFRDDYILAAGEDNFLISAHSSFSMLQRNFISFLSPLFVLWLFTRWSIIHVVLITLFIQLFAWLISSFLQKKLKQVAQ